MAIYTELSFETAKQILTLFDLEPLEEITPMLGGQANSSYIIRTSARKYVLTICDEKSPEEVQHLLAVLDHLAHHYYPTTGVHRTPNGNLELELDGKPIYLKEYVEGEVHDQLNKGQLVQLGQQLSRLHFIAPPPQLLHHHSYGIECFHEVFETASDDNFGAWLKEKTEMLNQHLDSSLPRGFIHGDLFADNTVFRGDTLIAVLDFEEACHYYKVFDLGMSAIGACVDNGEFSFELFNALLTGYEMFRKLEPAEREQLKLHTEYAAIATAFWRFRQYHLRNPVESKKSAHLEMKRLADQLAAISNESFLEKLSLSAD